MAESVCAVLVTYNRRELLGQALDRLGAQTRPADAVLVVDNASTDGTDELLRGRRDVEVLRLAENGGGAGGFARGLEHARAAGHDWYWLMDDDTFPEPTCLAELLDGAAKAPARPSLMTSVVRWKDGRVHPMNRPWPKLGSRAAYVAALERGLLPVGSASFVSTMVHREAIDEHGVPHAHFFIWHDDSEYTRRVLRTGSGYLAPRSLALHWTAKPHNVTTSDNRGRFYYKVRNHLWMLRGGSFHGADRVWGTVSLVRAIRDYVRGSEDRRAAVTIVARGVRDGLRRPPA